jgi:hypothetical protein
MKKFLALLGLAVAAVQPAFAFEAPSVLSVQDQIQLLTPSVAPLDLINWKVGDNAQYDVSIASFGKMGTMTKAVTKDEGTAIWITQNVDLMIQKQKIEMLINKADGQVLKTLVDGKEQQMPDDKIEIISQDYTDVTVPAGTFKAIHIVAKSKQAPKIEVWANPRDTVMDGTLKQAIQSQGMDIVMALTKFSRMP